jgi:hypothetical protein
METPVQMAARLLAALTELIDQEGMYLRGGYFDLAAETRQRADPLVRQLAKMADVPGVGAYRPQVDAVLKRSARHATFLQEKLEELGAEIRRIDQARHRAAQVAPAYAHTRDVVTPRFQAAG